jgi:hypothetical protein
MNTNREPDPRPALYLLLLAIQLAGVAVLMWKELPAFEQLVAHPGDQIPQGPHEISLAVGAILPMQAAYWYRLSRMAIPFDRPSAVLSHLLLFFGRLIFIFGGALFSVVFFRHLPALDADVDIFLMAKRGPVLVGSLFALFCVALELERLGNAFGNHPRN